jgi:signal transduction histidine kinase
MFHLPGLTLRGGFSAFAFILATAALLACGMLVASSAVLMHLNTEMASNLESVRDTQEVKIDLLEHARATQPAAVEALETDMLTQLDNERGAVRGPFEQRLLDEAQDQVHSYLEHQTESSRVAAYDAVDALVRENAIQAERARHAAIGWTVATTVIGGSVAALLALATATALWWLRSYGISPMLSISEAMGRFARGERSARANVSGAAELREVATRFNEMASKLAAERESELTFYAGVAHDLRTPLTSVKLAVGMIRPDRPLPPEDRMRSLISRIGKQVASLERMIGDVADLSSVETGRLELRLQETDLAHVVREALDALDAEASSRVRFSASGSSPVRVDPMRLSQVVHNLTSNALKYSPPDRPVEVRVTSSGDVASLEVRDEGPGISHEDLQRVFEPFRRVGLERAKIAGSGLGLFVSRQIVEAHHGRIEVDSTLGRGSTFRVLLPLAQPARSAELG